MSSYAIGDVQGCFEALIRLLKLIKFDEQHDRLIFLGDLVNRGNASLETLRFVANLPEHNVVLLGNHDLHFLSIAFGAQALQPKDTLHELLEAPYVLTLAHWLRHQHILFFDETFDMTFTHAGIPPLWTLAQAQARAKQLETVLKSEYQYLEFFKHMHGNSPTTWSDNLNELDQCRLITNAFTRMRFCDETGALDLIHQGGLDKATPKHIPWFQFPNRAMLDQDIVFGHWAALEGDTQTPHTYALDTGCVWGGKLTAMRLEDLSLFGVPA